MRVNIDYRAVNPFVWYVFFVNYGGDPADVPQLPREAIDLYSKDLSQLVELYYGRGRILPTQKLKQILEIG